ncbi:MAG: hypothetical protein RL748_2367 [Pseudomonadota bacterium]|jgi:hypothetical protein
MINAVLSFLKSTLNNHLRVSGVVHDTQEDQVIFPPGTNTDTLDLKLGAVSLLLVRLEQEKVLRAPDLYRRILPDGSTQVAEPEIRLELYVLFAARYPQYEDSLRNLSAIISYFQHHRVITHDTAPELGENIQQLVLEMVTLSFAEQNEIWGSLRLHYQPSALYKVKMIVYQADARPSAASPVSDLGIEVRG